MKGKIVLCGLLLLLGIRGVANADDLLQVSFAPGAPAVVSFTTEIRGTVSNVSTATVTGISVRLELPQNALIEKVYVDGNLQSGTGTIDIGNMNTGTTRVIKWSAIFSIVGTYTIKMVSAYSGPAPGTVTITGEKVIFRNPDIIIADAANNRVIEVDSDKNTVWEYTNLRNPYDAKRLANGNVLITEHSRHRVIEVDRDKNIVWQYGITDGAGSGYNQLNAPVRASRLSNGNTLIVDHSNGRVIEVNRDKQIVWQMTGLYYPCDARKLPNGNVLIAANQSNRIIEVDTGNNSIRWAYDGLNAYGVYRMNNGNTLIADTGNNRVIEVNYAKSLIWEYKGLKSPASAIELSNGNILISDNGNHRVMEVNRDKVVLWQYGETSVSGYSQQHLAEPFGCEEVLLPTLVSVIGTITRISDRGVLSGVTITAVQNGMIKGTTATSANGRYILD
ncbi:MAG: PQQ-binding-like beta-propeller repeat protein, partial [bacterium]